MPATQRPGTTDSLLRALTIGTLLALVAFPTAAFAETDSPADDGTVTPTEMDTETDSETDGPSDSAVEHTPPAPTCEYIESLQPGAIDAVENGTIQILRDDVLLFSAHDGVIAVSGNGWYRPSPTATGELQFNTASLGCKSETDPEPTDPSTSPPPTTPTTPPVEVAAEAPVRSGNTITVSTSGGLIWWESEIFAGNELVGSARLSGSYTLQPGETVCVTPAGNGVVITNRNAMSNLCFSFDGPTTEPEPTQTPRPSTPPAATTQPIASDQPEPGATNDPSESEDPDGSDRPSTTAPAVPSPTGSATGTPSLSEDPSSGTDSSPSEDDLPGAGSGTVAPALAAVLLFGAGASALAVRRHREATRTP